MSLVWDLILIIIAAAIIYTGWKNGFVKSITGFATNIAAIIAAYAATPYISDYLLNNVFLSEIAGGIKGTVGSVAKDAAGGYDFSKLISEMPEILTQILTKYNVSEGELAAYVPTVEAAGEAGVEQISRFIATPVATVVSNAVAYIIAFVAALIVLKLAAWLIMIVFKAPILKEADKGAGAALGAVNALFVLWVLSVVISAGVGAAGSFAPMWFGENVIENTFILKFLSEINPITLISNLTANNG